MIKKLDIRNFKSLKNVQLNVARLNVLTGVNGMGKSSVLQSLLLFRQFLSRYARQDRVALADDFLELGNQKDVFYCYSDGEPEMSIAVTESSSGAVYELQFRGDDETDDTVPYSLSCNGKDVFDPDLPVSLGYLTDLEYISAHRQRPKMDHDYFRSAVKNRFWGRGGENAVAYLAEHRRDVVRAKEVLHPDAKDFTLEEQVNAWMSEISPGVMFNTEKDANHDKVSLAISFAKSNNQFWFRPQNVGFGISFVLPMVIMLLTAREGSCLILENPEAHLHPRGQTKFGLLLSRVAASGVQIFVETHSDHVVNGIRVAVKKGEVAGKDVSISYFHMKHDKGKSGIEEMYTEYDPISIDSTGKLSMYPDGFLDEWNNQLMELW